jgi:hypothetical protein
MVFRKCILILSLGTVVLNAALLKAQPEMGRSGVLPEKFSFGRTIERVRQALNPYRQITTDLQTNLDEIGALVQKGKQGDPVGALREIRGRYAHFFDHIVTQVDELAGRRIAVTKDLWKCRRALNDIALQLEGEAGRLVRQQNGYEEEARLAEQAVEDALRTYEAEPDTNRRSELVREMKINDYKRQVRLRQAQVAQNEIGQYVRLARVVEEWDRNLEIFGQELDIMFDMLPTTREAILSLADIHRRRDKYTEELEEQVLGARKLEALARDLGDIRESTKRVYDMESEMQNAHPALLDKVIDNLPQSADTLRVKDYEKEWLAHVRQTYGTNGKR